VIVVVLPHACSCERLGFTNQHCTAAARRNCTCRQRCAGPGGPRRGVSP